MQNGQGFSSYHLAVNKVVLVTLRVLSLKRSMPEAFAIPFRVLNRKKYDRRYLTINFISRRYSKQSSLSVLKSMKVSVNALF